ncbi:MAG: PIN domain-containing protein [Verrucomicrobiae bacterium]|nr:PIN domain-containing protein [Verrucomicrobiae bacterium]
MVLVDSSVWIESLRRNGSLEAKVGLEGLLEESEALWCGPIKLEVLGGARREDRAKMEFFFECIPCRAVSDAAWNDAKWLAWKLRDKGYTLPWNDVLIASLALSWGVRVYALDQHFEVIGREAGLPLYKPGYGGMYQPD